MSLGFDESSADSPLVIHFIRSTPFCLTVLNHREDGLWHEYGGERGEAEE